MTLHCTTCDSDALPNVVEVLESSNYAALDELTKIMSANPVFVKRITALIRDMVRMGYL